MRRLILIITLLSIQCVFGENTVRLYCFKGENLKEVSSYLTPILKDTDSVSAIETTNCLEVHLSSVRIPLFDSWLSRRYKFKNDFRPVETNSKTTSSKECRLELVKKNKSESQTSSGNLNKNSNARIHKSSTVSSSRSRFLMTAGEPFSFQVNNQNTFITCHKKSTTNYQIRISLSDVKGAIATSLSLTNGGEVNIGNIVEDLNSKSKSADLKNGLGYQKTNSKSKSDYILKMY